jgi:hypothetical protein
VLILFCLSNAKVLRRGDRPARRAAASLPPDRVKTPEIRDIHSHDGGTITAAAKLSQMNDILLSMQ